MGICLSSSHSEQPSKKKRQSRWGSEESRTAIPGLPTVLSASMSEIQQKSFLCECQSTVCQCVFRCWGVFP